MRTLLFILLVLVLYWSFRELLRPRRRAQPPSPPAGEAEPMVRDAECGVYLPVSRARSRRIGGNRVYFCSEKCEREYRGPKG